MPINEVINPIGRTVPGTINLLSIEAADKITAPNKAAVGNKKRLSSPTMLRAKCGAISPTKPIVPTKQTAVAVISETIIMTKRLTL